jgi:hypothetical protein
MEPGINVARVLPIDGALVAEVLLRLRRDAIDGPLRWTLGNRGTVEVDVNFTPAGTTVVRIWDPSGLALVVCGCSLIPDADTVTLALAPIDPLPSCWSGRLPELLDIAHAAVDELAEELLWHATRATV